MESVEYTYRVVEKTGYSNFQQELNKNAKDGYVLKSTTVIPVKSGECTFNQYIGIMHKRIIKE